MAKIEDVDKNFIMDGNDEGLYYVSGLSEPIRITGLAWREVNGNLHRLRADMLAHVNNGLRELSPHTAGVQASFRTNSKRVSVKAQN